MTTNKDKSSLFSSFRFNSSTSATPKQEFNRTASINDSDEEDDVMHHETPKSSFASGVSSITPALHKSFISDGIGSTFTSKQDENPQVNFLDGSSEISISMQDYFRSPQIKLTKAKWTLDFPKTSFCEGVSSLSPEIHKHFVQEELEEETSSSSEDCIGNINGDHDILRLADQEDALKSFRVFQMRKMTELSDQLGIIREQVMNTNTRPSEPTSSEKGDERQGSLASLDLGSDSKIETPLSNQDVSEKSTFFENESQKSSVPESEVESKARTKSDSEMSRSSKFKALFQNKIQNAWNQNEGSELPEMQGYLEKRSTRFLQMWQTRYVVLKDKKLQYYTDNKLDRLNGCLDFDLFCAKIEVDQTSPKKFSVYPIGGSTTFYFKAENAEEAKKWITAIRLHISVSDGSKCKLNSIAPKRNFWKHVRISEAKFLAESKTGDILLFKTQNLSAIIQRSVTWSEYDHVGMVLKDKLGNIILFESTGNDGVGLCRWTSFKFNNWHTLYKKVVFRKLHVERTKEFIEKAEKFVKNSLGKKYSISAKKLLQTKSSEESNDSTFFCSELVAACYKKLGLLPSDVASSSYFPGTFSSEKKMDLLGGAKLGEEYLIDFNL